MLAVLALFLGHAATNEATGQQSASTTEIRALIDQLGDDRHVMRVHAREQLQELGLEAFDELHQVLDHDDTEIAMSAKYLLSSLLVSWSKESDPAPVRRILSEYGGQEPSERESRIELLARLPERQGLEALARLVRFEPMIKLSRKAALALMQQPMSDSADQRRRQAEAVLNVLQESKRQSADWLRVYAKDLSIGGYSIDPWRELLKKQRHEIDANTTDQNDRASVLELIRICATRAALANERGEAIRLATDNMDLISPTTRDLVDACSWAIDNDLHEFVLKLRDKNTRMFNKHAILSYGAAQAELIAGNKTDAERIAKRALSTNGFPDDEKAKDKLSDNEVEEIAQAHLLIAEELSQRGLFDWAEREYRHIVDNVEVTSFASIRARGRLAEMLGELMDHDGVISVLQPLIDRVKRDNVLQNRLNMSFINISFFESLLGFHQGLKAKEEAKLDDAKRLLRNAFNTYQGNIDILIAMYNIDSDDDWNQTVRRTLASRVRSLERDIGTMETQYRELGNRPDDARKLAQLMNEYAWLVSNTEGDQTRALEQSKRSLELTPDDAAKTDTLARCYLAVGQFDKALETQQRAVELMPHSPPMLRQLNEIQELINDPETQE